MTTTATRVLTPEQRAQLIDLIRESREASSEHTARIYNGANAALYDAALAADNEAYEALSKFVWSL